MPMRAGSRSSASPIAIRIIRRFPRVSTLSTAGPSTATWSPRCRKAGCARHVRGAWMTAASSRRSRLRKRLDHHHEDDGEHDDHADEPVGRRLAVEALVGGARWTFLLDDLQLLAEYPRVEADGHHDQQHKEDQGGNDPAAQAPIAHH